MPSVSGASPASPTSRPITPSDTAIILIDHQPGVLGMVSSLPASIVTGNVGVLARLGEEMGIPLLVTSTRENVEYLGTTLASIRDAAPKAYGQRVRRGGSLNAFTDPAFVDALEKTKRSRLVVAGLLTDVCLFHSVRSAIEAGYEVYLAADACGTTTALADAVTYDRMRDLGIIVTTTYGILFELYSDLGSPDGKRAEALASSSQVTK